MLSTHRMVTRMAGLSSSRASHSRRALQRADRAPRRRPLRPALPVARRSGPPGPSADPALVAAAQKEGTLSVIALPHDWCNYGEIIDGFKAKYGLAVNEITPDAGSGDEIEAIKANKDNPGPAGAGRHRRRPHLRRPAKADKLIAALQGLDLGHHRSDKLKDPDGYWYGDYYGILTFEMNKTAVKNSPKDWPDLLKPEYKNQVALAGDPRPSSQAIQRGLRVRRCPTAARSTTPSRASTSSSSSTTSRQLRPDDRQAGAPSTRRHADHHPLGLQRARPPGHAQPATRRSTSSSRPPAVPRRLRAGHQRLRAAPERRQALDGVPVLRRGPGRLAEGLLPPDPLRPT